MVRLRLAVDLDYDTAEPGCDFIFNIYAALTERQRVLEERLTLSQDVQVLSYIYPSRYCQSDRLHKLAMREFGRHWQSYGRATRHRTRCRGRRVRDDFRHG